MSLPAQAILRAPETRGSLREDFLARVSQLVSRSLRDELLLTPKPGLVDREDTGSHRDLTLDLMLRSIETITPYFTTMMTLSYQAPSGIKLREALGRVGREAEAAMLQATGGVNTHRGAIWALGLLCSAAAQDPERLSPHEVCGRAARLAGIPDSRAPLSLSHGLLARQQYNAKGARAEAQEGFPHVLKHALPTLWTRRKEGCPEEVARLDSLLSLLASLEDTCVLFRAGREGLELMHREAQAILELGGVGTKEGQEKWATLGRQMKAIHASPGGAADLLAATFFIDALQPLSTF